MEVKKKKQVYELTDGKPYVGDFHLPPYYIELTLPIIMVLGGLFGTIYTEYHKPLGGLESHMIFGTFMLVGIVSIGYFVELRDRAVRTYAEHTEYYTIRHVQGRF